MLIVTIFEHTLGRQRKSYIMNIAKIFCRALKLLTREEQNCKGTETGLWVSAFRAKQILRANLIFAIFHVCQGQKTDFKINVLFRTQPVFY